MNRLSLIAAFVVSFVCGAWASHGVYGQTPPSEEVSYGFHAIPDTIFEMIGPDNVFLVPLSLLNLDLENATDTSVPDNHFFHVNSPCLNRISHVLEDWIDSVSSNLGIYKPGDDVPIGGGQTEPFEDWLRSNNYQEEYEENFFLLLQWCIEKSKDHHPDCFADPSPGGGGASGGGGSGGSGSGSGGGGSQADPDPSEFEWDLLLDELGNPFQEKPSDCKEAVRWLLNMAVKHFPDGGTSDDAFRDFVPKTFDQICPCDVNTPNNFEDCPEYQETSHQLACESLPSEAANDGLPACPSELFGDPDQGIDCFGWAAQDAYTAIINNYDFDSCEFECEGDGEANQRIRDVIAIEMGARFQLIPTCGDRNCETALNFREVYDAARVPMNAADHDFLRELGGCNDCYGLPINSALGVLDPTVPAGMKGTDDGSFRCDWDFDGEVTPMDALMFARATMRADAEAWAEAGGGGPGVTSPGCNPFDGSYRQIFSAYSQYDWAEQFLTNAADAGCDIGDCGDRESFIRATVEFFERFRDQLDLPPGYDPLPPGLEEWSRPRTIPDGVPYGGVIFEDGTSSPDPACSNGAPEDLLKGAYLIMEADEAEGDIEDIDEAVADTCPPSEEPASTHAVSSPPARIAPADNSDNPVRLTTGEKVESAVDLSIPLSGKDFRLVRNYRSLGPSTQHQSSLETDFTGVTGGNLVGKHWNLPLTMWIDEQSASDSVTPRLFLNTTSGPVDIRLSSDSGSTWGRWRSQRTQRLIAGMSSAMTFDGEFTSEQRLPVWRLIEPGAYTLEFWRGHELDGDGEQALVPAEHQTGLLLRRIDAAGNIWQYIYKDYHEEGVGPVDSRPIGIRFLRAPGPGETVPTPMAELHLDWDERTTIVYSGGTAANVNYGRLREARVVRFADGETVPSIVTHRVLYTYFNSLFSGQIDDSYSEDLGSDGDLIQVTKLTRLDASSGGQDLWRTQITQYRYHAETYDANDELTLSPSTAWDLKGHRHALKAVIYPEQIERFAFHESTVSDMAYIADAAKALLAMDDFHSSDDPLALRWAGKVITKYEPVFDGSSIDYSQPFRVREQIMTADCGCSASSSIETRLTYEYFDLRDVPTSIEESLVWSVHLTEWNHDGTTWIAQTTLMHDYVQQSETQARLRLQNLALAAPVDSTTGQPVPSTTDYWVTRYEYDRREPQYGSLSLPRDAIKAILYPSAMSSYTPAAAGTLATYTAHSDQGLVVAFNHNEEGRLTHEYTREGWLDIPNDSTYASVLNLNYTKIREIVRPPVSPTYFKDFGASIVEALPEKEIVYADSSGTIKQETEYGFAYQNVGHGIGNRLVGIAEIVRAAGSGENGSGGTGLADATRSVVFFDFSGEVKYVIDANDSLTHYTRQGSTGRVASITANADASAHTFPTFEDWFGTDPALSGFTGRHSDGGSLTTEIVRDAQGRITTVTSPGGIRSSIVRSIEPWDFTRPGEPTLVPYSYYTETVLPHYFEGSEGGAVFAGTASRTWFTADGTPLGSESYILDPASVFDSQDPPSLLSHEAFRSGYTFDGPAVTRGVTGYSDFGVVEFTAVWPDLTAFSGSLSAGATEPEPIRPRVSTFTYDYRGNLVETRSPDGSVQAVEYDILNRPIAISLGTDSDPSSGNMVTVRRMWYDFDGTSSGVGDGHLTLVRESPSSNSSDDRDTELRYDYRGRLITVINPESPHAHFEYDNLDRTTTALLFDDSSGIPSGLAAPASSARLSKIDFHYDSHGRLFRRSVAIDPTSGSSGTLDEFMWYDLAGQAIAAQTPSAPKVKMQYDGLGRLIRSYVTADANEVNPTVSGSFADTYTASSYEPNLSGDVVYEQTEYHYIKSGTVGVGRLELVTSRSRLHGTPDSATGPLGGTGVDSINTYNGFYYDPASRLVHTVQFGTNDGSDRFIANTSAPTIDQADAASLFDTVPASLPSDLQDALITSRRFDQRGRMVESLSPWRTDSTAGTRTRSLVFYNDLSELVGSIENAMPNGSGDPAIAWNGTAERYEPASSLGEYSAERSRAMSFNRNSIGQVTRRMVWRDATNAQTTLYEYEHGITGGALATDLAVNWLVRRVNYPDETSGNPNPSDHTLSEEFAYNRLGELVATVDQNSTQHTYTRDALGRVTRDQASIFSGSGIDSAIVAIEYEFDAAGRLRKVQSIGSAAAIENAMRYTYDSLWRLTQIEQNPLGDIGANPSTGIVSIEYEDVGFNSISSFGTHNISRATELKYPLGAQGASAARTVLSNTYGPAAGLNDIISRATGFQWNRGTSSTTHTVAVQRLGLAAPVKIEYGVPGLALDRIQASPSLSPQDIDQYNGLDRFGRITSQMWIEPGRNPVTEQAAVSVGYTYNRIGNIIERSDERIGAAALFRDETYEFDELDRLTNHTRTPNGSNPFEMDWTLDTFGNWSGLITTSGGTTTTENREHNQANELTKRTIGTSPGLDLDLTFDHAGNLTKQYLSTSANRRFIYDAWNRLVAVQYENLSSSVQDRVRYRYYPGGERAASLVDTDITSPILPDELNLFYYDASWRLLEIRTDDETARADWSFPSPSAAFDLSSTRQFIWGEQYIDELVAYMRDTAASLNTNGTLGTNPTFARLEYALTDRNFSVIGMGFTSGSVGDRVRYEPYGLFRAFPAGDVNGDGTVNSADTNAILLAIGYQADLDVNMDGAVDSKDSSEVSKLSGRTLTAGQLSDRGNIVGWCGYLYEESTGMWLARHRWQIPELGRWANRDPIGYAGGSQNLYEYVNGNPVGFVDPWGLSAERPLSNSAANIVSGAANLLRRGAASAKKCICKLISKDQWKEIALSRAGIHSDTLNAMIQARDSSVGMTPTLNRIYDFYAEMGEKGPEFLWYKAARHARGPILEAADKLHNSTGEFWTALRHQRGIGTFADRQAAIFLYRTAAQIFEDMSWQAVAYEECGIDAIRSVRDKSPSNMRPMYNEIVAAWELVVNAYDFHTYADAALEFVYIEQQYSAQPGWEKLSRTVALYASRYRAGSPYPGVMSFSEFDSDKTNSMRRFDRRHRYLKYATLEIMYLEEYNP